MAQEDAYSSKVNATKLNATTPNPPGQSDVYANKTNAAKLNTASQAATGQVDVYASKANAAKLNTASPNQAGQSDVYGSKINAQRLSYVNTGDVRPGQVGAYSTKVNSLRLTSVNPDAFTANASLFSRIGAEKAVSLFVRAFYGKALRDERVRKYFDLDTAELMEQQIQSQLAFMRVALDGPNPEKIDLRVEYAKLAALGITHQQFDAVAEYSVSILRGQNTPEPLIDEVLEFCESIRKNVLG
jgi:truncated hemoglobin YjbI